MGLNNCEKCLKNDLNLMVGATDRKHITITDASNWMNNDKPESYEINITNLENNISGNVNIKAKGTNVLSSIELFGTKDKICLKDGFYCIKCLSCGKEYTITRVYIANTECMIDHLFIKANNEDELKMVNDLYNDLKMVQINTELGRLKTAEKVFNTLTRKLNTLGCDECSC